MRLSLQAEDAVALYINFAAGSLPVGALVLLGNEREPLCEAFTAEAVPIIGDSQHEVLLTSRSVKRCIQPPSTQ